MYNIVIKSELPPEESDACGMILNHRLLSCNEINSNCGSDRNEKQTFQSSLFDHNNCKPHISNSDQIQLKIKEEVMSEEEKETSYLLTKDEVELSLNNENVLMAVPENTPFECEICHKVLQSKKSLQMHNYVLKNDNLNANVLSNAKVLLSHLNKKICLTCGKTFENIKMLKCHRRTHKIRGSNQKKKSHFECVFCQKKYKSLKSLKIHLHNHTEEKPYCCELCNKCFTARLYLNVHQITHSRIRKYKCDKCLKTFTQKGSLNLHVATHSGLKPFACDVCGKCFTIKSYLKYHQVMHTGIKAFKCVVWEKSFARKCSLNTRMAQHK